MTADTPALRLLWRLAIVATIAATGIGLYRLNNTLRLVEDAEPSVGAVSAAREARTEPFATGVGTAPTGSNTSLAAGLNSDPRVTTAQWEPAGPISLAALIAWGLREGRVWHDRHHEFRPWKLEWLDAQTGTLHGVYYFQLPHYQAPGGN